jgi:predicted kinase
VPDRPTLYLLSGLPCSGKSTYSRQLETSGVARVSVDEMMIDSCGRLGIDYDRRDHMELLAPIMIAARVHVAEHLSAGHDVVLDHGLGRREERDEWKHLAETHSAGWKLLSFDADISTLRTRARRRSESLGTVPIDDDVLDWLAANWERPSGEGETVIVTD